MVYRGIRGPSSVNVGLYYISLKYSPDVKSPQSAEVLPSNNLTGAQLMSARC